MSDLDQIRQVLQGAYAAISGPAGPRDWKRHDTWFTPDARSMVVHRGEGPDRIETLTRAQYQQSRGPFFEKNAFWEVETRCDVIVEGDLAVAMSHYESFWDLAQPPFERGTNSVQLVRLAGQWRIASIMWTAGVAAQKVATGALA
jgi:hypothetical protein